MFIHKPGLTAVEQILGQELTPEHRTQLDTLIAAFHAGDMDAYDEAMTRLCAMTGPDQAHVITATMLFVQSREAFHTGDKDTARAYLALSEARFDERIRTAARLVGLLTIGLQTGELPDHEYDLLANGLLTWDGWYPDKAPVVDEPTARVWLTSILRIDVS